MKSFLLLCLVGLAISLPTIDIKKVEKTDVEKIIQ